MKMHLLPLTDVLTILFVVPFAVSVAHAGIPVEDKDRDPTTGYSEEPGVSYSWAWMYAVWNPVPQTYSNHAFDHDANIEYIGGQYMYEEDDYPATKYPHC
jgi:hypothetical protein